MAKKKTAAEKQEALHRVIIAINKLSEYEGRLWLIATPCQWTYEGMTEQEVSRAYQKQAFEEWDKQFKSKDIVLCENKPIQDEILLTKIVNYLITFNGVEVPDSFMLNKIYTQQNNLPFGEVINIKNLNSGKICISEHLENFYLKHNWLCTFLGPEEICQSTIEEDEKELIKMISDLRTYNGSLPKPRK